MDRTTFLTPVGRLVAGSPYEGQTKNQDGTPKVVKQGANAGHPRTEFYFGLAIAKTPGQHWAASPGWGATIWQVGNAAFPQGQAGAPSFAWKIVDGDSTVPNKAGKRPCDNEGYPGHWILNFTGGFAPGVYNKDGSVELKEAGLVKLGDYIQVSGNVTGNNSTQSPGVYLNHDMVAFAGVGKRISSRGGPDASAVGFGQEPLPVGAQPVPATPMQQVMAPAPVVPVPAAVVPVVPSPAFLAVPAAPVAPVAPVAPARVMTPKAQGASYEQLLAAGWTDQTLVQHGLMVG